MINRRRDRVAQVLVISLLFIGLAVSGHAPHHVNVLWAGLGGALGCALTIQLVQLWQLLTGWAAGYAVTGISIGSGHRLAQWRVGGMPVALRRFLLTPLMVETVLTLRPALRLRIWVSMLLMTAAQLAAGLWLVVSGGSDLLGYLGVGVLLLPVLSLTVLTRLPLSAGWVLFRLPFLPSDTLDAFALTPGELAATRALRDGRIAAAAAALGGSAGPRFQTHLLRASIALGEGRYADASAESRQAVESAPHARTGGTAHLLRATALVGAAETGALPPSEYLPWLAQAVEAGRAAQPILTRFVSAPADLALLQGRREEALTLARKAAGQGLDTFWRAQGECSYAAALAAGGRHDEARAAVERARTLMPELARIATVEQRIGLSEVTTAR